MTIENIENAKARVAESAFDFLQRAVDEIAEQPKYSVVHFATAVELLLKARLMNEHWALTVDRASSADVGRFLSGECRTVGPAEAIKRLRNICSEVIPSVAEAQFERLASHRNRIIHFYHEAGTDGADDGVVQEVVAEQCKCWFHLEKLLRAWSEQFEENQMAIDQVRWRMGQNRAFLQVKFDEILPKIDEEKAEGKVFCECSGCGFEAAELVEQTDRIRDLICRVCWVNDSYVELPCPSNCGTTLTIVADHGSDRTCGTCDHEVSNEELTDALETGAAAQEDYIQMNCAYCMGMGSVIEHHDWHVCIECLSHETEIALCEWCNEMQIGGGDLDFSYHTGCEFCDGHAGYHRDD